MSTKQETSFRITSWDEQPTREFEDGAKISVAHVTQEYEGELNGAGAVEYVMCYQDPKSAIFTGIEFIEGTLNGEQGSFVIRHDGVYENGVASSNWQIVPGSGREALAGISGSGSFAAGHGGEATVVLNLAKLHASR